MIWGIWGGGQNRTKPFLPQKWVCFFQRDFVPYGINGVNIIQLEWDVTKLHVYDVLKFIHVLNCDVWRHILILWRNET